MLKEKLELIPKTYYSYLYIYNCLETINIRFCKLYPVATLNSLLFFNIPQSSIEKSLTAFVILVTNLLFKIPSALFINGIGEPALKIHILLEANNIKYISDSSSFPKRKEKKRNFLLIQMVVRMVRVVGVLVLALVSSLLDSVGP